MSALDELDWGDWEDEDDYPLFFPTVPKRKPRSRFSKYDLAVIEYLDACMNYHATGDRSWLMIAAGIRFEFDAKLYIDLLDILQGNKP